MERGSRNCSQTPSLWAVAAKGKSSVCWRARIRLTPSIRGPLDPQICMPTKYDCPSAGFISPFRIGTSNRTGRGTAAAWTKGSASVPRMLIKLGL